MKVEVRADNTAEISGYVNVVERESRAIRRIGGKPFHEIVRQGTFAKALKKGRNVKLMLNHRRVLCDTSNGLELREDNVGLHAKAVISDNEAVEAARSGKLTGWSFGFYCNQDRWSENGETRTLEDIELDEVSILTLPPAYLATSVEVRGEDTLREQRYSDDISVNKAAAAAVKPDFSNMEREIEILRLRGTNEWTH